MGFLGPVFSVLLFAEQFRSFSSPINPPKVYGLIWRWPEGRVLPVIVSRFLIAIVASPSTSESCVRRLEFIVFYFEDSGGDFYQWLISDGLFWRTPLHLSSMEGAASLKERARRVSVPSYSHVVYFVCKDRRIFSSFLFNSLVQFPFS